MNRLSKYGLILLTALGQPDRNESVLPEAEVISIQTQKVRGSVEELRREATRPDLEKEQVRDTGSAHILSKTLDRNKQTNTEEGFWNTASRLESVLRERKMRFTLREHHKSPGAAALAWNMNGEVLYCFTLPNPENIDVNYQFNVTFQEYMKEGSEWVLTDQEVLRANTQSILNKKVLEVMGFDHGQGEYIEEE